MLDLVEMAKETETDLFTRACLVEGYGSILSDTLTGRG